MNPRLVFFGGVGTATGANIMLAYEGRRILVDCGLLQGKEYAEQKNFEPFKYDPASVDFLIVTHAHLDHVGKIPKLVKDGFKGRIISTKETKEIAEPILRDALKVMKAKYGRAIFEESDIKKSFSLWESGNYGEEIKLFGPTPQVGPPTESVGENCILKMQNAGHILGSAICNVICGVGENKKTIAFTGDLGNSPSLLLPDVEFPKEADYLIMESVYGDRNHDGKKQRKNRFKQIILDGIKRGGTIVLPAFSLERTQVMLYELNNMIEDEEIPQVPVFLDSPLAQKITEIYRKHEDEFKEEIKKEIKAGDDIFSFPGLRIVKTAEESAEIEKIEGAKIILAGSGMSEGGRVVNHEMSILGDPKNTLVLVGYQSPGTFGRRLEEGVKELTLPALPYIKGGQDSELSHRLKIIVRAKIEVLKGYSSHMDSEHLVEFVEKTMESNPDAKGRGADRKRRLKVFVIMGEPKSSLFLCQRIREYLDIDAVYPEEGKEYELI